MGTWLQFHQLEYAQTNQCLNCKCMVQHAKQSLNYQKCDLHLCMYSNCSCVQFANFQLEGLKSQNHCLWSLRHALWKFESPQCLAHFSRLNFWEVAVHLRGALTIADVVYIHTCMYVYIYIYIYTLCVCIYLSLSLSIYIYIYTHTHIYTYVYIATPPAIGWHYLSNTTCLMRPHLFDVCFVVSRIIILCETSHHVGSEPVLDK